MKFLLDQDVYAATALFLRKLGHDVLTTYEAGLSAADDAVLLEQAVRTGRTLVTRDRDFGGLVLFRQASGSVIYLRSSPATATAVHEELARVLATYDTEELAHAFVVVEPARHRIRHLPLTDRR